MKKEKKKESKKERERRWGGFEKVCDSSNDVTDDDGSNKKIIIIIKHYNPTDVGDSHKIFEFHTCLFFSATKSQTTVLWYALAIVKVTLLF